MILNAEWETTHIKDDFDLKLNHVLKTYFVSFSVLWNKDYKQSLKCKHDIKRSF